MSFTPNLPMKRDSEVGTICCSTTARAIPTKFLPFPKKLTFYTKTVLKQNKENSKSIHFL